MSDGQTLPLLKFPLLEEPNMVRHGFTTRLGGVSEGIFSALNLSFTRGDDPDHVTENYRRLAGALGVDLERIVCSDQTHTTNVRVVTEADAGKGVVRPKDFTDVDGLITDVPGLTLATFFADCVPLYFVDPVHRAIGLSHSGWRGTVARMGEKTLQAMAENYGTRPEEAVCAIGPSICQDCYEVSADVAEIFAQEFAGHEAEIIKPQRFNDRDADFLKPQEMTR
ncbi:MAG: polyphenol oxidase family protein [Clostridiales bacterium]|nr:polyphenol oxidase family protein [Clostridiales bacterium]